MAGSQPTLYRDSKNYSDKYLGIGRGTRETLHEKNSRIQV